jgi:hypothetical protein
MQLIGLQASAALTALDNESMIVCSIDESRHHPHRWHSKNPMDYD